MRIVTMMLSALFGAILGIAMFPVCVALGARIVSFFPVAPENVHAFGFLLGIALWLLLTVGGGWALVIIGTKYERRDSVKGFDIVLPGRRNRTEQGPVRGRK